VASKQEKIVVRSGNNMNKVRKAISLDTMLEITKRIEKR
jgi:hypothetical protein